ncbi:two-component response regulator-like APRR2 isoform X2 [Hibiscus syriacus]|uniref:two-component response regulator-like APRR2 isoform X2 n=1 Tax=Hibiscus syriacus TaxID=106335 RepID=UPI001922485A|nr:two-component response regulator-like APRR2 isoform X2 [Hibiscus syriacus]
MVCTANDLSEWKDFPKGLRVLLLDEDTNSAAEIKSKLESMDYIVYTFRHENEALSAISSRPESFHVAIVEVGASNNNGSFKFLEMAKDLPTIMTSNIHCISTMVKCIALGAVEFLRKPLSEDKLRNVWQHVVHKAFNRGGNDLTKPLKPVKDSLVSILQPQLENGKPRKGDSKKTEGALVVHQNDHEPLARNDKYPAPSTPQLEQGGRLLDDRDCHDHTNYSEEKENGEQDGKAKSVETTSGNRTNEVNATVGQPQEQRETKRDRPLNGVDPEDSRAVAEKPSPNKANRKKSKVDWTPELHKKFVEAVDQLGIDQAIPSRILELMKVEGLTRQNVASHLQKYRMQRRHILPKEDDRKCPQRHRLQSYNHPNKPIMAFPPYYLNHVVPYPMLGAPCHSPTIQMWGVQGYYPPWQPTESWHFLPPLQGYFSMFTQEEEVIDKTVKEAISMPWLPLPLGLKPPSTESVLAELSRQGISAIDGSSL